MSDGKGIVVKPDLNGLLSELGQLNNNLQQLLTSGQNEDYFDPYDVPIPTAAGSQVFSPPGQIGWIYIPVAPRDLTIYGGIGHSRYLGTVPSGSTRWMRFSKIQDVTIEWAAGAAAGTLTVYFSSRPYEFGGDGFVPGSGALSLGKAEDSPAASGDIGVMILGQRNDSASTVLTSLNGDYSTVGVTDRGAVLAAAIANVTSSDGNLNSDSGRLVSIAGSGASNIPQVYPYVYNGATWDRPRTPNIFKSQGGLTSLGDFALWTPAAGKKFRIMRYMVTVLANSATAGGASLTVALNDSATGMGINQSIWVPAVSVVTAAPPLFVSPWIDLGNGILSAAANNVLNVNLSVALTAGGVRVHVCGTEE